MKLDNLFTNPPVFTVEVHEQAWRIVQTDEDDEMCDSCIADTLEEIVAHLRKTGGECEDNNNEISLSE